MYQPLALENDGAVLNFMNNGDKYSPRNEQDLRETHIRIKEQSQVYHVHGNVFETI
jgi:hypothetical protein